ncbi:MAG: DUF4861 family protein [Bacteroidota bacterium]
MRFIIYFFFCLFLFSQCDTPAVEEETPQETPTATETQDRVQAVLHIQDKPYNNEEKSIIDADYTPRKEIVVPNNLDPQNKWVMFEGPVLENDQIAYRFYMDSRHRYDIYGKLTPDLVMDTVGWDYHDIMDWGSDILKVGNSLGMGSPAVYLDESVITFSDYQKQTVSVTKDDEETACVTTLFEGLKIGSEIVSIEEEWCLSAGSPMSNVTLKVVKGTLPEGARWATGVVKHLPDYTMGMSDASAYLYTWGKQSYHEEMMGMAVLVDKDINYEYVENAETHLMVAEVTNEPFVYQFGAAWERDVTGIKNAADFEQLLKSASVQ